MINKGTKCKPIRPNHGGGSCTNHLPTSRDRNEDEKIQRSCDLWTPSLSVRFYQTIDNERHRPEQHKTSSVAHCSIRKSYDSAQECPQARGETLTRNIHRSSKTSTNELPLTCSSSWPERTLQQPLSSFSQSKLCVLVFLTLSLATLVSGSAAVSSFGTSHTATIHTTDSYLSTGPSIQLMAVPTMTPTRTSMPGYQISGATASDKIGRAVSDGGDVNGDGISDILIGAPQASYGGKSRCGMVYVLFGSITPTAQVTDVDLLQFVSSNQVGYRIIGHIAALRLGWAVSGAGDVNGDGYGDIVIGTSPNSEQSQGFAYLIFGQNPLFDVYQDVLLRDVLTTAPYRGFEIRGAIEVDYLGSAVSSAGDFNGDGYADVIIGASLASFEDRYMTGGAYVLFGHSNTTAFNNIDIANFVSNNTNGFVIRGEQYINAFGVDVSGAGDINNDGLDDIIIGATGYDRNTTTLSCGMVYVIFGHTNVSELDMRNFSSSALSGLRIVGAAANDLTGGSVSTAGDFNHDGIADFLIGARQASPGTRIWAGCVYVLFGHDQYFPFMDIDLATMIDGTTGFRIYGVVATNLGKSVSNAGDVNGDGIDDIIIGAPMYTLENRYNMGIAYVLYGKPHTYSFPMIDLAGFIPHPAVGFWVMGVALNDQCGFSVSSAGDINGDGGADVIVGSWQARALSRTYAGSTNVYFGIPPPPTLSPTLTPTLSPTLTPTLSPTLSPTLTPTLLPTLLPTLTPTVLSTISPSLAPTLVPSAVPTAQPTMPPLTGQHIRGAGTSVSSAGDVNGDGIGDYIIGAPYHNSNVPESGVAYVIFGNTTMSARDVDLRNFTTGNDVGFRIFSVVSYMHTGWSVGGAGDVNGDGYDDVVVGSNAIQPSYRGQAYVIFGHSPATPFVDLYGNTLALAGYLIIGSTQGEYCGYSVSGAGDYNGDGYADVIIGAPKARPLGRVTAGKVYVLFGHSNMTAFPQLSLNNFVTSNSTGFVLYGADAGDQLGMAVSSAGDFNNDGLTDVVFSAPLQNTSLSLPRTGVVYVVFGRANVTDIDLAVFLSGELTGVRLFGITPDVPFGLSVSGAGDYNNDGISDVIIGSPLDSHTGSEHAGVAVVIYGRSAATRIFEDIYTSTLSQSDGFVVYGAAPYDQLGSSVSGAGDVNRDGIDDIMIGAANHSLPGNASIGKTYVIFGRAEMVGVMDLSIFVESPTTGLVVYGQHAGDQSGVSVSAAGDVNGDGGDDLIIGAAGVDEISSAYILYGMAAPSAMPTTTPTSPTTNPTQLPTSAPTLAPLERYSIIGGLNYGHSGSAVADAGDVNGDGFGDVIVGTPYYSHGANTMNTGMAVVVFGKAVGSNIDIDLLNFTSGNDVGFKIISEMANVMLGYSVSGAGDVNGDNYADVVVGSQCDTQDLVGYAFVVFGHSPATPFTDILVFTQPFLGFIITGVTYYSQLGYSVSGVGDFNGDTYDDIVIGSPNADPNAFNGAGNAYVILGHNSSRPFANIQMSPIDWDADWMGFTIFGGGTGGTRAGDTVNSAGDVNGDGLADVMVTTQETAPPNLFGAGIVYVIFGRANTGPVYLSSFVSGVEGFRVLGASANRYIGVSVRSAGDVNGDKFGDVIIGAPYVDVLNRNRAGAAYVIFGHNRAYSDVNLANFLPNRTTGFTIVGAAADDGCGLSVSSAGDINADGIDDVVVGAPFHKAGGSVNVGEVYVIFGSTSAGETDIDLNDFATSASTGYVLTGTTANGEYGHAVSRAGDVNGDGGGDIVIGAWNDIPKGRSNAGSAHVLFGIAPVPSAKPTAHPTVMPSVLPTSQPSVQPSSRPTTQPAARPTSQPSHHPSAQPSTQPTRQPSGRPTAQPSWQPSSQPSARPSAQPSSLPTVQPSAQPSAQPTSKPSAQPSSQPSRQPTSQPTNNPSHQPSGQPTAAPSSPFNGEWATVIDTQESLPGISIVDSNIWACGGTSISSPASCVLLAKVTGEVVTQYGFADDTIGSVIMAGDVSRVIVNGRSANSSTVSSAVANCRLDQAQLTCSVKSFVNAQFLSSSYVPFTSQVVYVGQYGAKAAASILSNGVSTVQSYTYSTSYMKSIALIKVASLPNFIGSFVTGTSVANNLAQDNSIVAGWIRVDTGVMIATYLTPIRGQIVNTVNAVNALAVEPNGPDSFIAGGLEITDGAGMQAYIVRASALYRNVVFGVRYVNQATTTGSGSRRALTTSFAARGVVKGMVYVDSLLFVILDDIRHSASGNTTHLSIVKAQANSGSIVKQVSISAPNTNIRCSDITSSDLMLIITCTVQQIDSTSRTLLLSVNTDLNCTDLPRGYVRKYTSLFRAENLGFTATAYSTTTTSTWIDTVPSERNVTMQAPTAQPSPQPSSAPSGEPTLVPSVLPSAQPSSSPTSAPSVSPQPTSTPSTSAPTITYRPTVEPTVRPSHKPSAAPTLVPSKVPSRMPSAKPVVSPTARPTYTPTIQPSRAPTLVPSALPTVKKSPAPSAVPTKQPTFRPTARPTTHPTIEGTSLGGEGKNANGTSDITPMVIGVSVAGAIVVLGLCVLLFYRYYSRDDERKKMKHVRLVQVVPSPEDQHPV